MRLTAMGYRQMTDYIKEMRKLIGHKPLLVCGASTIVINPEGKVLMLHRSDNDCWCFPGGALELGENLEETAMREVLEETGLTLNDVELFGVFSGEDLHYTYPNGDEVYIVDVVFKSASYIGELQVNEESRKAAYFDIDKLPEKISPPVKPVAEKLKQWLKSNTLA
jgi:8-oxo-dGTP pyrophosphatase MutT (NUDIX family)